MRLAAVASSDWRSLHAGLHGARDRRDPRRPWAQLGVAQPFRNAVAQARPALSEAEHESFFRDMLADIREPVLPFGLSDVHGEGRQIACRYRALFGAEPAVAATGAAAGRQQPVCATARAQVLASVSGRDAVVFGTVLLGRLQGGEGAERALGLFINTLPLRLDIDRRGVETAAREAHVRLSGLLAHEHAPLALAQRCSGVSPGRRCSAPCSTIATTTVKQWRCRKVSAC